MSEFHVRQVTLGKVIKHSNADTLSLVAVDGDIEEDGSGYPVIFRTGDFKEGDQAIYIPVDAIVSGDRPEFAHLGAGSEHRIKAKKLRGIFSQGLLIPVPSAYQAEELNAPTWQEFFGIRKWEPAIDHTIFRGPCAPQPVGVQIPVYDLEGYRKYGGALVEGEEVVLTEKIHGANMRFVVDAAGELHVGSRTQWKGSLDNLWWLAFEAMKLDKAALPPEMVFYGEVYGQVQDLKYGVKPGEPPRFAGFDILDRNEQRWLNYDEAQAIFKQLGIPTVPELYRGPWKKELLALAEQDSTLHPKNIQEGFVARPPIERAARGLGRVVLKVISKRYLLRKEA